MKSPIIVVATLVLALTGCGTAPKQQGIDPGQITAINAQKLSTTFKRQGVKLEWECAWGTGMFEATCMQGKIKAIEVTGYAPSFGNSEVMRETAFTVAHDVALGNLIRFVKQDIATSRVTNTLTKNVEKANDRIKAKIRADEEVTMSDEDAAKDTNYAVRENINDTVRTVTDSIRSQATGIVRGVRVTDESIVDRQTVSVTIRWSVEGEKAADSLRKHFGN